MPPSAEDGGVDAGVDVEEVGESENRGTAVSLCDGTKEEKTSANRPWPSHRLSVVGGGSEHGLGGRAAKAKTARTAGRHRVQ